MNALETVLKSIQNVKVIDQSIDYKNYISLGLSNFNVKLSKLDIYTANDFEKSIENYLTANKGRVAFGGYNEERNLDKTSTFFNDTRTKEKNIHIGLDLWIKAGTAVLAALDGIIHSFNYNAGLGDYGPSIILEHKIKNQFFHTLYGRLSLESIFGIEIGDVVKKGQQLATFGNSSINGDYALHF